MRWRVDFESGFASFDSEERAREIYEDPKWHAIRLRKCENIFDDGFVIEGMPIFEDLTQRFIKIEDKN